MLKLFIKGNTSDNLSYQVIDDGGRVIDAFKSSGKEEIIIDTDLYPTGVYFIKAYINGIEGEGLKLIKVGK